MGSGLLGYDDIADKGWADAQRLLRALIAVIQWQRSIDRKLPFIVASRSGSVHMLPAGFASLQLRSARALEATMH